MCGAAISTARGTSGMPPTAVHPDARINRVAIQRNMTRVSTQQLLYAKKTCDAGTWIRALEIEFEFSIGEIEWLDYWQLF